MAKFRSKPDYVDAVQWRPGVEVDDVREAVYDPGDGTTVSAGKATLLLPDGCYTIIHNGDWMVTHPQGPRSIMTDAYFREQYEPAAQFAACPECATPGQG